MISSNSNIEKNKNLVLQETNIEDKISLYGLYDPDENNLSIEMWKESEGEEIKKRAPLVDFIVGPQSYHKLPEMIESKNEFINDNFLQKPTLIS